jgi:hypothetical protein
MAERGDARLHQSQILSIPIPPSPPIPQFQFHHFHQFHNSNFTNWNCINSIIVILLSAYNDLKTNSANSLYRPQPGYKKLPPRPSSAFSGVQAVVNLVHLSGEEAKQRGQHTASGTSEKAELDFAHLKTHEAGVFLVQSSKIKLIRFVVSLFILRLLSLRLCHSQLSRPLLREKAVLLHHRPSPGSPGK